MEMTGDTRVFLVINTVEYNGDGKWLVQDSSFGNLRDIGFDEYDLKNIDQLSVGGKLDKFAYSGVIVIRVA